MSYWFSRDSLLKVEMVEWGYSSHMLSERLLTGCQVLLWNKPIKSSWNQSVQIYTKTGLEISIDFGPENMSQYVANLD